jgi:hypothetical protein
MTPLFFLWSGFMIGPALLFPAESVERDFGYPQLTTNGRGDVIDLYYWATKALPQQQIAATISKPGIRG